MDSIISELHSRSSANLRHLSLEEVPEYIGGSKPTKSVGPCQLHMELLSRVEPVPPLGRCTIPIAPDPPSLSTFTLTTTSPFIFSVELQEHAARHRNLTLQELDEWLAMSRHPRWTSLMDKIRNRNFQLEPTMYEDFLLL